MFPKCKLIGLLERISFLKLLKIRTVKKWVKIVCEGRK